MLKLMRDRFQQLKWILIAVVAIFILFGIFIDWGSGGVAGAAAATSAYAARVNGETISFNDYNRALKNYEDMYRQAYGGQFTPEMAQAMGLPKQVLDSLIEQRLIIQEAERLNLTATPQEVRAKLLEIPVFTQDGKFVGMESYTRYVTGPLGYPSASAFEESLARDITLQKMQSAFENSIVISPKAAEAEYRRMNENAKIRYVLYPAARDAATVTVSDAEVQTYFNANQSKYQHGEQRQVRYLLADVTRLRAQIKPTEADLRKRYETNREEYRRPDSARVLHILVKVEPDAAPEVDAAAKAKADALVAQLRGGADFGALAMANSQDPSSSGNGGDMGFVDRGQTVEAFERAIFSNPLNTVDVVRTPEFGYHIIKVTERRPAGYRAFEEVRGEIAARAAEEMAQEQARAEITRINSVIRNRNPKTVEEFVANATDKVTSNDTGWFTKAEPIPGLGQVAPLSTWAFSAKQGDIGEVTGTPRGMVIPFMAAVRPAGVPDLKEIRPRVEEDARQAKARDNAARSLKQAMAGATSVDAIAQQFGLTPTDATVNRQAPIQGINGSAPELVDGAINGAVGSIGGPVNVNEGAVIFQIVEQKKVTPAELTQNRASYLDQVRQQQARSLRQVLVQRLRKEARVEINEELTRPATQQAGL